MYHGIRRNILRSVVPSHISGAKRGVIPAQNCHRRIWLDMADHAPEQSTSGTTSQDENIDEVLEYLDGSKEVKRAHCTHRNPEHELDGPTSGKSMPGR